ncbi:MAG: hypothetical protein WAL56_16565 [Candidatus Sulfotelmatobacter sp.]
MVALVAAQAEKAGAPLNDEERTMLLNDAIPGDAMPGNLVLEELDARVRKLIEQTFDGEIEPDDPKNLGNSLQWAGDGQYPKIVALTEDVIRARGEKFTRLRGRRWVVDRIQLVGCGVVVVIVMMLVVVLFSWLFGDK